MSIERYDTQSGPRYLVRVDLGPGPESRERRQRKRAVKTMKAARALEAKWRHEIETGTAVDTVKSTLGAYALGWLAAQQQTKHFTTAGHYTNWVHRYIIPYIGDRPIQQLTGPQIRAWRTRLLIGPWEGIRTAGYAPATVRSAQTVLAMILEDAQRMRVISHNPARHLGSVRDTAGQRAIWTAEEARAFLAATATTTYGPLWLLALHTGMRRGELLGLRWQDVDLERGVLTVRQQVVQHQGRAVIGQLKSRSSARAIPLPAPCVAILTEQRGVQRMRQHRADSAWRAHDLVFSTVLGDPLHPCGISDLFRATVARLGLPAIRFHDLRHTHATLLLAAGVGLKAVSSHLGHSSIGITGNVYAHITSEMQRATADTIGAILSGETGHGIGHIDQSRPV